MLAAEVNVILSGIAEGQLGIETLQRRGRDRLDFHEVYAPVLRKALLQAYVTGYQRGAREHGKNVDALMRMLGDADREI
jgi:hypothetical protein